MGRDLSQLNGESQLAISVTFRHTEATEALKKYATDKVSQRVKKYIHGVADVQIVLVVEKLDHIAEVHVRGKGVDAVAKAVTGDLYSAIDKLVDVLETQLRKHKDKMVTQRHHVEEITF